MSNILALESCTDACSVALSVGDKLHHYFEIMPRQHSKKLLPMVKSILAQEQLQLKDLDAVAFARGPGSFAGVRIGTATAQGLAFAADLPVLPISSLAAMALRIYQRTGQEFVVSALDARMDEIYVAAYQIKDNLPEIMMPETVCSPKDLELPEQVQSWIVAGSGWQYLADMSEQVQDQVQIFDEPVYPAAAEVLLLAEQAWQQGKAISAEQALPVYLRDQVAKKKD